MIHNDKAKSEFIQLWGTLGSQWGINRSMAQIHALLLITPRSLSADEIMEELQLSRGNTNMNLRELISWNLIYKEFIPGDRKDYFFAEYDVWTIAVRVMNERKKREFYPAENLLQRLSNETYKENNNDSKHMVKTFRELTDILHRLDQISEMVSKAEQNVFFKKLTQLFK